MPDEKQTVDAEIVDETEAPSSMVLQALTRAEVDIQIATAKRYPRVVSKAIKSATEMATLDEDTAESCRYSLKRKDENGNDKVIEGPSVRLSEIVQNAWGNLRSAGRLIAEDEKTVRVQGVAFDLETNSMVSVEVTRGIWSRRRNSRYNSDMIAMTINAAISIAVRNAIFKVVPRAYADRILEQCKLVMLGKGKTMEQRRKDALAWWETKGVTEKEILAYLHRDAIDDITVDDLLLLSGVRTALKEEQTTIDLEFRKPKGVETTGGPTLASALAGTVTTEDDTHAKEKPSKEKLAGEAKSLFGGKK